MRAVLVLASAVLMVALLSRPPTRALEHQHQIPLLPRAELLKVLGASNAQLVADYFWIQTIQATGSAMTAQQYADIFYYADLTTDLAPGFLYVYQFAGVSIPFNQGREQWLNTELSTRLLEKGLRAAPNSLQIKIQLAYNLSYFAKEHRRAAALLEEAARLPGAPGYLPALATRLYAQSGEFESGLALATSMRDASTDPETRAAFDQRIKEIELERVLRSVDQAYATFREREGRPAAGVLELVARGDLRLPPIDPLGGQILVGENGKAYSTAAERRLKVHLPLEDTDSP